MFQSLFYWKSFCNIIAAVSSGLRVGVSILVLLEILLQHKQRRSWESVGRVSILVLLEILLQLNTLNVTLTSTMFQSLFYWKSFCNYMVLFVKIAVKNVSILVLLEILLQHLNTSIIMYQETVSILVLLEILLQQNEYN